MPRPSSPLCLALIALVLAGCQLATPGGGSADRAPETLPGAVIEVAPLAALPAAAAGSAVATDETATRPLARPAAAGGAAAVAAGDPPGAEATPPPGPASALALACEDDGGTWASAGVGDLRVCLYRTRDAGTACRRESDCEGQCLARSGTCSPIRPLLGCHEILKENGARVTQCIR